MVFTKKVQVYGLLIVCSIALGFRVYHLGVRDFWYDEAFTGIAVKESWSEMMRIIRSDMHPPLYFLLLKGWGSVSSYSVESLRLFSVVGSMLGVLAVFALTRELYGPRAGLYAAGFTAITPFAVSYGQEARMYSWYAALIVYAAFALIRAVRSEKIGWWVGWGVLWGAATLTHYMGLLFAPLFYGVSTVLSYRPGTKIIKNLLPGKKFLLGCFVTCVMFLPWLPTFYNQWQGREESISWIPRADTSTGVRLLEIFLVGTPPGEQGVSLPWGNRYVPELVVGVGVVLFFIALSALLFRKYPEATLVALILSAALVIGVVALSFFGFQYTVARYILPAAYGLYILLGAYLAELGSRARLTLVIAYMLVLITRTPHVEARGYNELSRKNISGQMYYVLNSFDYVVAKYYFGSDRVILYNKDNPAFNPASWTGINGRLLRTEHLFHKENTDSVKIIYNRKAGSEHDLKEFVKQNNLALSGVYDNLVVLSFAPEAP